MHHTDFFTCLHCSFSEYVISLIQSSCKCAALDAPCSNLLSRPAALYHFSAKEKADGGCEKLACYLKTRGKDKNMFLSASNRNRRHCTGNAVEGTMMADEPARVLSPHLAILKWCELHSRRYYKNKKDAYACDTFLTPPYMDKLASLVDRVRVCPCLWLLVSGGRAQLFFFHL